MRTRTTATSTRPAWLAICKRVPCAALLLCAWLPGARAQQDQEQPGIEQGNYNIKQSVEFGGRLVSITGDQQAYDTFVNLQEGLRLLVFTTEMRVLDHTGARGDHTVFSNFG